MKLEHNKLPEVNQFIKENNLKPCLEERLYGSLYNSSDDVTYLVIDDNYEYTSYGIEYFALREARNFDYFVVTCRGKIHEQS